MPHFDIATTLDSSAAHQLQRAPLGMGFASASSSGPASTLLSTFANQGIIVRLITGASDSWPDGIQPFQLIAARAKPSISRFSAISPDRASPSPWQSSAGASAVITSWFTSFNHRQLTLERKTAASAAESIHIVGSNSFATALADLQQLTALEADWDGEGALAPPAELVEVARSTLFELSALEGDWSATAHVDGRPILELHQPDRYVEIIVGPEARLTVWSKSDGQPGRSTSLKRDEIGSYFGLKA